MRFLLKQTSCYCDSPQQKPLRKLRYAKSTPFRIVVLVLTIAFAPVARAADAPVLPTISFYSLGKDRVTLPADFHSDRNLLLLYFELTQQPDVDSWHSVFDQWRAADPSLASYTSLVSGQKNFLSRWWQNASMRSAAPDTTRWHTTIPLYLDKRVFEQKLWISSEKQVVLLFLDRKGHVLSRVTGPPTDSSRAAMRAALQSAGSPISAAALPAKP